MEVIPLGTTVFTRGARLLLLGIFCLLMSAPVLAETQKLTLPQIIEYSLQNNGTIQSMRAEKGIHDAGKTKAGLLPNPTLELEGGTGALTGSSGENNLSVGVSQEFFLAGKREKRLAIAEWELEMFRWQLADKERMLREEVKTVFYDVILNEQRIALVDRSIALNHQLFEVTKKRLAADDIPELEINLVKVELTRSEAVRIDVEKLLNQSQAKLWTLIGFSSGETPAIDGAFEPEVIMAKNLIDFKQLANEKRPDIKALEAEKNRGQSDLSLAETEGIPNLTAGLAVKRDTTTTEVGGLAGKDTAYTIGLKLSIPIPVFDKNQAGVQEAMAKRNNTESRLAAAAKIVEREVETAYTSLLSTEKVLSLYRTNIIPQLEENLKLTREAYRLGEVGILNVIQEQKKFFEINESYLTALYNRQIALVRLESALATDLNGGVQ
jgi:outer membrane protein, heavy metal efflux system